MSGSLSRGERMALGALGAVATARAAVAISPSLRFDTDPAIVPGPLAGIGPSGSMLLDAIGALAVALLAWHGRRRGAPAPWCALLVLLPLPAFVFGVLQPWSPFADLWRGSSWLVAALAAAVISWRGDSARTIVGAVLLGVVGALLVRSASQLAIEHPAMVAHYEQTRHSFLAARGWAPDSPAALAYERRLRQPEASAWFGLANVNSGVLAAGALLLAALACASRRPGVPRGAGLVCALGAIGSLAVVLINGGKGAIGSLAIGAAVMALLLRRAARTEAGGASLQQVVQARGAAVPGGRRAWAILFVALAFVAFPAIVVRGALLGESGWEERSLLFRWYYLLGSLRILVHHPWLGVGAGGFQEAFILWRPWFSPEEVMSAHSAWLDWLAAFGLGGLGLVLLSLRLLVRGAMNAAAAGRDDEIAPPGGDRADLLTAGLASLAGAGLALAVASPTDFDPAALFVRLGASLAALLLTVCTAVILARGNRPVVSVGAAVAALVLLMHGQLDMTFWLPGSVWWAWLALGIAASGATPAVTGATRARSGATLLHGVMSALAFVAFVLLAVTSLRAGVQERAVERAARSVERAVERREAPPRSLVADALADAALIVPGNEAVWLAAVEQALMSVHRLDRSDAPARHAASRHAVDLAMLFARARPGIASDKLLADALMRHLIERRDAGERLEGVLDRDERGEWLDPGVPAELRSMAGSLLQSLERLTHRDPRSTGAWIALAEARLMLGDERGASSAARRALEVDSSYRLDPVRMLTDSERRRIERLTGAERSPTP